MRGRGAKRRTSSVLPRRIPQMSQRQKTSVRGKLAKRCRTRTDLEGDIVFVHILQKELQTGAEKGSLKRLIPGLVLTFLRAVHFWILENQELKLARSSSRVHAFRSPSQKPIISRRSRRRRRTSVFLHYRTERALRAIT